MRSSTSSSEAVVAAPAVRAVRVRLLDRRVWVGLALIFIALEIFTRSWLFSVSKDFRRFRSYPARAQALVAAPGAMRVAMIGNSATDRGVDGRVVESELGASTPGRPTRADLFVADQSRIDTWRFVFERYFAAPALHPDLVVVTFYENDLEDGNPVEIGRLAQFFTGIGDWPEVMTVNLHSLDDRVIFAASSVWATFAASDRIRERLLGALVPDFREHSERVNMVIYEHEHRRADAGAAARAPSFVALQRLVDRAAGGGRSALLRGLSDAAGGARNTVRDLTRLAGTTARRGRRFHRLAARAVDTPGALRGRRPPHRGWPATI